MHHSLARTLRHSFLFLGGSLLFCPGAFAANTSLENLLVGVNARPMAMGGAFVAVPAGLDGVGYSPASFGGVRTPCFEISYLKSFMDQYYASVDFGYPLDAAWTVGSSILYFDGGTMEINYLDGSSENKKAEQDLVVLTGLGYRFENDLSIGAGIKAIRSTLIDTYQASAFAVDAGIKGKLGEEWWGGFSLQNIGTSLRYLNTDETLPVTLRAGVAFTHDPFLLSFDLVDLENLKNNPIKMNVGAEYALNDIIFRAGLGLNYDVDTFTVGLGMRFGGYRRPGRIDYSFQTVGELSQFHRTSLYYELPRRDRSGMKGLPNTAKDDQ